MIIQMLARGNRSRPTASTQYTGTGGSHTVTTGVDAREGVIIFANRDTSVFSGLVFGDDATTAIRMGGGDTPWSSAQEATISGLTINANSFSVTSAFDWNVNTQEYIAWSIRGGAECDVVTWSGNGSTVAVSHGMGVEPGAAIVCRLSGGTVDNVWFWSLQSATDHTVLRTGANVGSDVYNTASTSSVTWEGAFSTSSYTYKAVLFPTSTSFVKADASPPFGAESIGWKPQFVFYDWANGFASLDNVRDGGGGSNNSSDLSTTLNDDTSGTNTGSNMTLTSTGFNAGTGTAVNYVAFR